MDETDAETIRQSQADPEVFEAIFERHFDAIYAYVARRAGREVADVVTSETFCAAFGQRVNYDPARSDARPWLYGIATNLLRRHWRSQRRRQQAQQRLQATHPPAAGGSNPADDLAASMLDGRLQDALAELSTGDRDALLLFAWGQLSYRQVADALEIPLGTVQSRIHRARQQIRRGLTADRTGSSTAVPRERTDG